MSPWAGLAVSVVLVGIAYVALSRQIARSTSRQAALDEIRNEVAAIINELNQTTDRSIELIEDRVRSLTDLISQADRRVAVLKREQVASRPTEITYTHLSGRRPAPGAAGSASGTSADEAAAPVEPPNDEAAGRASEEPPRERVRRLYHQGLPVSRIASIVGKTIGEVELIISLSAKERENLE